MTARPKGTGRWTVESDPDNDQLIQLSFVFDLSGHRNVAGVFTREVAEEIGGALLAKAASIPDKKE